MASKELSILKKVQELRDNYNDRLSSLGVKCSVYLKKFCIFGYDGYRRIRISNKPEKHSHYKVIVVRFIPLNSKSLKVEKCKEYSFMVHYKKNKSDKFYSDTSILFLIEKLLNKTLNKLSRNTPKKVCSNKWYDFFRYAFLSKYRYMTKVFGIKTDIIDAAIAFFFAIALFLIMLLLLK